MRYSRMQCRGISAIGANSLLVEGSLKSFRLSVLNLTLARIILHTPKLQILWSASLALWYYRPYKTVHCRLQIVALAQVSNILRSNFSSFWD